MREEAAGCRVEAGPVGCAQAAGEPARLWSQEKDEVQLRAHCSREGS